MSNAYAHFVRKVFAHRKLLPGKFGVFAPLVVSTFGKYNCFLVVIVTWGAYHVGFEGWMNNFWVCHCCMCCVTLSGRCNCFWVVIVACVALFQLPAISLGGMRAVRGLTPTRAVTFNLRRHKSASTCDVYFLWD